MDNNKGLAMADIDWDEDDWESGSAEKRFHLGKEDGGGDMIKDDCHKYDDDDDVKSWCQLFLILDVKSFDIG